MRIFPEQQQIYAAADPIPQIEIIGTSSQCASQSAFGQLTGNDVSGNYKLKFFLFFIFFSF